VELATSAARIFLLVVLFRGPFGSPVIFLYDKLVCTDGDCGGDDSDDDYRKRCFDSRLQKLALLRQKLKDQDFCSKALSPYLITLVSISAQMDQRHLTRR
jgi:hypothetical protein